MEKNSVRISGLMHTQGPLLFGKEQCLDQWAYAYSRTLTFWKSTVLGSWAYACLSTLDCHAHSERVPGQPSSKAQKASPNAWKSSSSCVGRKQLSSISGI